MDLEGRLFYQLLFVKSRLNFEAQLKNGIFFFITAFVHCPLHRSALLSISVSVCVSLVSPAGGIDCNVVVDFCNFVQHTYILCSARTLSFLSKQTDLFPGVSGLWISSMCTRCPVHSCLSVVWQDRHRGHLIRYVHGLWWITVWGCTSCWHHVTFTVA